MKRYLVFAGLTYYPSGGWGDFIGSHDSTEDALMSVALASYDWWEIVDGGTGQVIARG